MRAILSVVLFASASWMPAAAADAPAASQKPAVKPAGGESSAISSAIQWFKNLKEGLSHSAIRDRQRRVRVSSVAAVRGKLQESKARELYWRDKIVERAAAAQEIERKELSDIAELAISGKADEAARRLDAFSVAHPKSPLIEEARTARQQLGLLGAAAAQ